MKSFTSESKSDLSIGYMIYVKNDIDRPGGKDCFSDLKPYVEIDGLIYEVTGIEHHATPQISAGAIIGIRVKGGANGGRVKGSIEIEEETNE